MFLFLLHCSKYCWEFVCHEKLGGFVCSSLICGSLLWVSSPWYNLLSKCHGWLDINNQASFFVWVRALTGVLQVQEGWKHVLLKSLMWSVAMYHCQPKTPQSIGSHIYNIPWSLDFTGDWLRLIRRCSGKMLKRPEVQESQTVFRTFVEQMQFLEKMCTI